MKIKDRLRSRLGELSMHSPTAKSIIDILTQPEIDDSAALDGLIDIIIQSIINQEELRAALNKLRSNMPYPDPIIYKTNGDVVSDYKVN